MKITVSSIKALNPCKERFDNFVLHSPRFSGSLSTFLALEHISYSDKIWVATRILSKNQLVTWSFACAESVQHLYEAKYPNSNVLKELFAYLKSGLDFENPSATQRDEIYRLRKVASAASSAASYAASAAESAARSATSSAAYAASSAASYAASSAASAAAYAAGSSQEEQRNLNLLLLASLEINDTVPDNQQV